jgi:hypothetical protein
MHSYLFYSIHPCDLNIFQYTAAVATPYIIVPNTRYPQISHVSLVSQGIPGIDIISGISQVLEYPEMHFLFSKIHQLAIAERSSVRAMEKQYILKYLYLVKRPGSNKSNER